MEWNFFRAICRKLFSKQSKICATDTLLPDEIHPSEDITRFIINPKHYSLGKKRVNPQALKPLFNIEKQRWETSIYRIQGLSVGRIWELGYTHVENRAINRIIRARGTGTVTLVLGRSLRLDVNGPPYPRHVDIIGWPDPDSDNKSKQLMKATEIADKMVLDIDPR